MTPTGIAGGPPTTTLIYRRPRQQREQPADGRAAPLCNGWWALDTRLWLLDMAAGEPAGYSRHNRWQNSKRWPPAVDTRTAARLRSRSRIRREARAFSSKSHL